MKKIKVLFVLFCVLIFSLSIFGGDDDIIVQMLSGRESVTGFSASYTSDSLFPHLVEFEEDGVKKIMAVWAEEGSSLSNLYYTIKENKIDGKWSTPMVVYNTWALSKTPRMITDYNNVLHLVWADGSSRFRKEMYHIYYKNKKWTGGEDLIRHHANDSFPSIEVLADNTVNVLWECEIAPYDNSALVMVNTWNVDGALSTWDKKGRGVSTNARLKNHATHGDMAVSGLRAYAVWQQGHPGSGDGFAIMFAEKIWKEGEDDHWTWPIRVSEAGGMSTWPRVEADSFQNVHVVWARMNGRYSYTSRIFGTWKPITAMNRGFARRDIFDLDIDENDTIHASFRGDAAHIYYNVKSAYNLGEWGQEIRVSQREHGMLGTIIADSKGYVHLAWCDIPPAASHSHDIWYGMTKARTDPTTGYPNADFTTSGDLVVEGQEVTFDASPSTSTGQISSYHWNLGDPLAGDDNMGEGKVVKYTYDMEGEYTILLGVFDETLGLIGTKKKTIEVIKGALPPVNVTLTKFQQRAFLSRRWVNKLDWDNNPQNIDLNFTIEKYSIFRKEIGAGEWTHLIDLSGGATTTYQEYFTSETELNKYTYGVSVTANNTESEITPEGTGSLPERTAVKTNSKDVK
ncbi:MAG: PKD domain-containing protein [Candidatus Aminicenantes bacterium]|nr:PKD domain-containing protein [Candidatus Aminicenantes bacterium]